MLLDSRTWTRTQKTSSVLEVKRITAGSLMQNDHASSSIIIFKWTRPIRNAISFKLHSALVFQWMSLDILPVHRMQSIDPFPARAAATYLYDLFVK